MFRKSTAKNDTALQSAIVTSDGVKRRRKMVSLTPAFSALKEPANKPVLIAVVVGVLVVGLPLLFYGFLRLSDLRNRDYATGVCKGGMISDARKYIDANDITRTGQIVDKVTKMKNYQTDANCQYVLVRYDIMVGNFADAQKQLNQLKKVYNFTYDSGFGDHPLSPQELQQIISDSTAAQADDAAQAAQRQSEQGALDQSADKLVGGGQ